MLVVALMGGAVSMWWHIHESRSKPYNYLAVVGLVLMAVSFVLVGISVGENPIWPGGKLIPMIRVLWFASALIFNGYLCAYWGRRLRWKRPAPTNQSGNNR